MVDHNRCAVCAALLGTRHDTTRHDDGRVTIVTTRWCTVEPAHAYGTRGVAR